MRNVKPQCCEECRFFVPVGDEKGVCAFNPPQAQLVGTEPVNSISYWPEVKSAAWCGRFRRPAWWRRFL